MKNIFLLLLFTITLFGSSNENGGFLEPEDAFKVTITKNDSSINIDLKLDKSIYVYDQFLKITIQPQNIDITKELNIPKPVDHDGFMVHYNGLNIKIPLELIKQKIQDQPYEIVFDYQGCSMAGLCYSPMSKSLKIDTTKPKVIEKKITKTKSNETDSITDTLKDGNIGLILITFFGFGLLLALTPCIFPMIPILSSIIVQQSNKEGGSMSASRGLFLSVIYVLSMSIAYTVAGVLAGLFGANLQAMLQDPVVISVFAAIFVVLAFSMFGYFEIGLPQSWQTALNKTSDKSSKKGGVVGVAVMGFFSALIVGPCVAPPLAGALVYIGQTGDAFLGGAALFVMSLGMGLPLLAIGVGAGKYMPKPGGWMSIVSKIFGIVMLAIALWMLERIIPASIFMLGAALILIGTALYLQEFKNIIVKLITTILFIYGITVFIGFIAGSTNVIDPLESFKGGSVIKKDQTSHYNYIKTVDQLEKFVKNSKKPVMVDFWASWCVSCKELDNITFKDPQVLEKLSNYNLVKIDVTKNTKDDKELMKKFNLFGPPALIFYKDGKEENSKRIVGYKTPQEFLEIIQ